jgi:prepilin-type N-terminal cleavage/methylation domain-containing protein
MKAREKRQKGFTLLEMMISVALLLVVSGAVFSQMSTMMARYQSEESGLVSAQDTRQFVDQMVRDLHQNAFPRPRMFAPSYTQGQPYANAGIAAGMVVAEPTRVQFEADLDGSGTVQVIVYQLSKNGALVTDLSQCPCVLQRGQAPKVAGTAPEAQALPTFTTEVDNVINPASEPPFRFFDVDGNELTSLPTFDSSAPNGQGGAIAAVFAVKMSVTVAGQNPDPATNVKPEVTYTAAAQMNN